MLSPAVLAQQPDQAVRTCLAPVEAGPEGRFESCSRVIARQGENPVRRAYAYVIRGWVQTSLPAAIEDFTAALAIDPDFDQALAGRARAFLQSGQSDRAVPDFTRVLARYPANVELLIGRGDAYNNLRRYDEGIADFDRALSIDPDNDKAMNDRAWALVRHGRKAEAIEGYDQALAATKTLRDVILANRCEAKAMAGDSAGALADCDAALALKPDKADYRSNRGLVHLRFGRLEAAAVDFEVTLAMDPNESVGLFGRGVIRSRQGDLVGGQADLRRAEQSLPGIREALAITGIPDR